MPARRCLIAPSEPLYLWLFPRPRLRRLAPFGAYLGIDVSKWQIHRSATYLFALLLIHRGNSQRAALKPDLDRSVTQAVFNVVRRLIVGVDG